MAAYQAGAQLRAAWEVDGLPGRPAEEAIVRRLAAHHQPVYLTTVPADWWRWFWRGWEGTGPGGRRP